MPRDRSSPRGLPAVGGAAIVIAALAIGLSCAGANRPPAVSGDTTAAYESSLAVFDDGLLVSWYDTRDGHAEIYVRPLDPDGRPARREQRLTAGQRDAYEPDVQPLGRDAFVVAWYEKDAEKRLVPRLGAWTRAGQPLWTHDVAPAGRNPVVRVAEAAIFAAWVQDDDGDAASVWGGWWNADGTVQRAARRLASAGRTTWNLNAGLRRRGAAIDAVVVFDARVETASEELFVVEAGDQPRVARLTADDGKASKYPDLALHGDRAALTWFDSRDGNQEIYLALASLDALLGGEPLTQRRITSTPGPSFGAYASWNDDRLGLAWCDEADGRGAVYLQTFAADGTPASEATRLSRAAASVGVPSIRPWRAGFALSWNEYVLGQIEGHAGVTDSRVVARVP